MQFKPNIKVVSGADECYQGKLKSNKLSFIETDININKQTTEIERT